MASATAAVAMREVEVPSGVAPFQQIDDRNDQDRLHTIAALPDQDDEDDNDDDAFSDDFGGVGP